MKTSFELGEKTFSIELPDAVKVLHMKGAEKVSAPQKTIANCLAKPIGSDSFDTIIRRKIGEDPDGQAVIVISDNTRPVPYKGDQGILKPLVEKMLEAGVPAANITVLCANGTHTPLPDEIFREMIDPWIYEQGISIINHDCLDEENLKFLGYTSTGTKIKINRIYAEAHIKILTGLVESHFMAGVSGGRKSICPGLIGEDSTFIFHGVHNLAHPKSVDLVLKGNPCHEEALEVAFSVGSDFIFNVTLNQDFDVTGFFAGDMIEAHEAAFHKVKDSVVIDAGGKYDIVITHAGFVGKNHYQAAKTGCAAIPLLKEDSYLIIGADCTDSDPVGKQTYKDVLKELKNKEADVFIDLLKSDDWTFVPDQWQVQMWTKVFKVIPQNQFIYYAPQIKKEDYGYLPGEDGNSFLPEDHRYSADDKYLPEFLESSLNMLMEKLKKEGRRDIRIAWMSDGPYGIVE